MKQFKTESKRILDLMINSIYTNKDIFLRELISNASDAIDKLHFISLTDSEFSRDFAIVIEANKEARQLIIRDNGIGMTEAELEKNLGTIAESGTLRFKSENAEELIGQFGVGFYSAFMVADKIEVISRAYGEETGHIWISAGAEGYTIKETEVSEVGTTIKLTLKQDDEDTRYSDYLEEYKLKELIKNHSDYIHYPIQMYVTVTKEAEGEDESKGKETFVELQTINSMTPLWKKQKSEVTDDAMAELYQDMFYDYAKPLKSIYAKIEGAVVYDAMLFVPSKTPFDYYTREYKRGLKLYSNGVLIMDKCEDILPDYLGFVQGIIDSSDISLNISREMLQKNRQVKAIASSLEKKIVAELKKMMEANREEYTKLFELFGASLKMGIYSSYGAKSDMLKDLIMFYSSSEKKMVSLAEYVSRKKADQTAIYYCTGDSLEQIDNLPQTELVKEKGYEILYFKDNVDEFVIKMLGKYDDLEFKSISSSDLSFDSEEEKSAREDKANKAKEMLAYLAEVLGDKVAKVVISNKLKSAVACVSAEGEISLEMEKMYRNMPQNGDMPKITATKVLELNSEHALFNKMELLYATDKDKLKAYAEVILAEALLVEGLEIANTTDFVNNITAIML